MASLEVHGPFEIEFEKPIPSVIVGISILKTSLGDYVSFGGQSRLPSTEASGDRRERTRITQRTIHAVANVLRM